MEFNGELKGKFDEEKVKQAIHDLLIGIGEDPDRDGLLDTPKRVAKAYKQLFSGLYERPEDVLATTFDLNHNELVIVKNINIFSIFLLFFPLVDSIFF